MKTNKKKIVLVEYFNTEPFLAGLKTLAAEYELVRKIPAECASYFESKQADIGLIPVASYFKMDKAQMITNYGIGCNGTVRTVVLFSNSPQNEITKIYLDNHSRTSVQLCKIITQLFWKIEIEYVNSEVSDLILNKKEAVLMIGDKVFGNEGRFKFTFDLGAEWKKETGLPFIFAVWVSHVQISLDEEQKLNKAFDYGIQKIPSLVKSLKEEKNINLLSYFEENIVFHLGKEGKNAIALFKSLLKTIN